MPRGVPRRAELAPVARQLRAEGLIYREIAARLGVSKQAVVEWCDDPDRSKIRARRARYGGTCVDCGGKTTGDKGPGKPHERCAGCAQDYFLAEGEAASRLFREEIVAMWREGLTIARIADELGWKRNSMRAYITRLRREGIPLPYRRASESDATRREQKRRGREAAKRLNAKRAA